MRIVYRMRGLLGDATEEFIESLDSTTGRPFPQTLLRLVAGGGCVWGSEWFPTWDLGVF